MRAQHEVETVMALIADGLNDCQIGRQTGIPRRTIHDWRVRRPVGSISRRATDCFRCRPRAFDDEPYTYLLGLYLGDGYISRQRRAYALRIVLDARYPGIIDEARRAVATMRWPRPGKTWVVPKIGCRELVATWQHWPCLFPQHGRGHKHERPIVLQSWQKDLADRKPHLLLRGLIHSDGCRVMNRVCKGKYEYPRYFFTNRSGDIRAIFGEACDAAGISWRPSNAWTISVARRRDVATLDRWIGPKR